VSFAVWPRGAGAAVGADQPEPDRVERSPVSAGAVVVGISGVRRNAAAAVCVDGEIRAACEQERVTRVRRAGLAAGALPAEALEVVLAVAGGLDPKDVSCYVTAEQDASLPIDLPTTGVEHHRAHASTAFYLSPHDEAAVLVCDAGRSEHLSVWTGTARGVTRHDWPGSPDGLTVLYAEAAERFGFSPGHEHELEALARFDGEQQASRFADVISYRDGRLDIASGWKTRLEQWLAERQANDLRHRARVAGAFQRHLGTLVVQLAQDIRRATGQKRLCLGGGLFYNTYFTTVVQQSAAFEEVFVPPNPGNAGVSIGAALSSGDHRSSLRPVVSPFLGPSYSAESIKRTLDNCKLSYEVLDEGAIVDALLRGQLVGWFQGRMEWGHRALGHRSILASPLSPYVLENLNLFLKHRPRHIAYGVSVPEEHVRTFFTGPPVSRFMEFEHHPADPDRLRAILPDGTRAIRVQTIPPAPADDASQRYRRLHEAFGAATGVPVLVNTSFNGFSEPMVCSPRDAVRVFFGSGLDLLVMDRFVIRK